MGTAMSFMGNGLPSRRVLSNLQGALYEQLVKKELNPESENKFHESIIEIFKTFDSALPDKHYDIIPSDDKIKKFFKEWESALKKDKEAGQVDTEKKAAFHKFMDETINKPDTITMITGIVTPPAAMAVKRAGEKVPPLKMIKAVPDVIFVPSLTVLALASAKLLRRKLQGNTATQESTTITRSKTTKETKTPSNTTTTVTDSKSTSTISTQPTASS